MEKIDLTKCYEELDESIKKDDHTKALNISSKILSAYPQEQEALRAKVTALIYLSKSKDLIDFLTSSKYTSQYPLEYAYALYEDKKYTESIAFIKSVTQTPQMKILLAQNENKLGNFESSYNIYKEIIKSKGNNIENEMDLLSNYFAAYSLSNANDIEFLKPLCKYVASWECYYNYAVICLLNGNYKDCFDTMKRSKEDFPNMEDDEFNFFKNLHLHLYIIQTALDGFELNKYSDITAKYEKFFETGNKVAKMIPYFYNNFLNIKKDKDSVNETIKKLDSFLKNEDLNQNEKKCILKNKINFLIRSNKYSEANEILNAALTEKDSLNDIDFLLMKTFLSYKNDKEKFDDIISKETKPEPHLLAIQLMLASINSKSYEQIHLKILNFISQFPDFCINYHLISFFLGFYTSKKLKDYLKEFLKHFKKPEELAKKISDKEKLKILFAKIASSFYSIGQYEESTNYYKYILNTLEINDKEIQILLMQSVAHIDLNKSEEIRRKIDESAIDLSNEHMNNLLNELFLKFRKPAQQNKEKKKKKRKIRYPKNFDPKNPGLPPDPERWLPKLQRKKYRNLAKNKMAYQGATADNKTTTAKFK